MVGDRLSDSGTRLNVVASSSPVQSTAPVSAGAKSSTESVHRGIKSVSRQSLLGKLCESKRKWALFLVHGNHQMRRNIITCCDV